ncbi:MAG: Gfo/Idh/MocA family oxidoreductase [Spirochaetes bacterium]|nr:Gfo/Idh/MocA family oxidoreductase [Spirochaetota bacterium]
MKNIALIGCGRIFKRQKEAILINKEFKITHVCDIVEERAKIAAEELGCRYVTDYCQLHGKNIDVVSIMTPSGSHPRHAIEVAEQTDIPNIIVEKPLSLTVREAYEMINHIEKAGKRLIPVYQNRYNPLVAYIKDLIDSNKLGIIYQFICNILWNRNEEYFQIDWHGTRELDGGVLYTQASHYVDMIHFFFGEIEETKGLGGSLRNLEVYDSISTVCRFTNGVIGSINATVNTYPQNFCTEFTIISEKGTIRLSGTNLNTIEYWNVDGMEKPNIDFKLDHIYGKGHDTLYQYVAQEDWTKFPSKEDVLSGIQLMEKLSY